MWKTYRLSLNKRRERELRQLERRIWRFIDFCCPLSMTGYKCKEMSRAKFQVNTNAYPWNRCKRKKYINHQSWLAIMEHWHRTRMASHRHYYDWETPGSRSIPQLFFRCKLYSSIPHDTICPVPSVSICIAVKTDVI